MWSPSLDSILVKHRRDSHVKIHTHHYTFVSCLNQVLTYNFAINLFLLLFRPGVFFFFASAKERVNKTKLTKVYCYNHHISYCRSHKIKTAIFFLVLVMQVRTINETLVSQHRYLQGYLAVSRLTSNKKKKTQIFWFEKVKTVDQTFVYTFSYGRVVRLNSNALTTKRVEHIHNKH